MTTTAELNTRTGVAPGGPARVIPDEIDALVRDEVVNGLIARQHGIDGVLKTVDCDEWAVALKDLCRKAG